MTDDETLGVDWSGLAILGPDRCFELLRNAHVGRLGFLDRGEVAVLPVNIALDGHAVIFRTGHGSKLSAAVMQDPVCIEIDDWDDYDHTGWSVLARGPAEVVFDNDDIDRFETLGVRPWATPAVRPQWVRVMVEEITGRKIVPRGEVDEGT